MGIFSGLFKSRDKPQNRTSGSGYSFFFGGSTAGKNVNEPFRHADDRRVLLRPHPGGSGGRSAAAPLPLQRRWRQGKGAGSSVVQPAPR